MVNLNKIKLKKCFIYFYVNVCKSFHEFYKLVHIILVFLIFFRNSIPLWILPTVSMVNWIVK